MTLISQSLRSPIYFGVRQVSQVKQAKQAKQAHHIRGNARHFVLCIRACMYPKYGVCSQSTVWEKVPSLRA